MPVESRLSVSGILFDKDGTLIDFNRTWLPIYQRAASCVADYHDRPALKNTLLTDGGYEPETQSWRSDSLLAAGSNHQIIEAWQRCAGAPFDATLLQQLAQIFAAEQLTLEPVVPNLPTLLNDLSQHFHLGVATMDDESHARFTLEQLQLTKSISFVCGADSGFGVKPEPGMVDAFASQSGLDVASIIVVGDSPRDLMMAQRSGAAAAIGVLTGTSTEPALKSHTAHVLESIDQLPSWLNRYTQPPLTRPL